MRAWARPRLRRAERAAAADRPVPLMVGDPGDLPERGPGRFADRSGRSGERPVTGPDRWSNTSASTAASVPGVCVAAPRRAGHAADLGPERRRRTGRSADACAADPKERGGLPGAHDTGRAAPVHLPKGALCP
ncbi:hypothetical protein Kpho02_58670 [Kitasatospora phosalacinea]|uniref:Uncharacterized protein n=1 Tax=Kitasatospora phosalacinea TaxID=2065 RepID=A0A9W6QEV1_9ACTN|nr:hypothetical protein Kpho02_58670 [Kitasatospora phosalacinea]